MKKSVFLLLLLVVFSVLMQGCTGNPAEGVDTSDTPAVTDPVVQDIVIVGDGVSAYNIVVPEAAKSPIQVAALTVRDAIAEATGIKPEWMDDYLGKNETAPAKEILIGMTSRPETAAVMENLPYGEYAIRIVSDKIVIAAWDDATLQEACEGFAAMVQDSAKEGSFTLAPDYTAHGIGYELLRTLPRYGTGLREVQFVDLEDDCYMLYAARSSVEEFEAYAAAMEDAGYTQFSNRQMGDNLSAIYTSEDKIIHAFYTAATREARVAIEDAYDMTIFTEQPYEKICEPAVSLIGLENYGKDAETGVYNQIGLSMVFRLEDGRFIVVDGGGYSTKTPSLLTAALNQLAVDKKKITVAAWILTHAHGDHTGAFVKGTEAGAYKKIKVQNIIHHFSTLEQYQGIDEGPDEGRATQCRNTFQKEYKDANVIKAHAGQVIRAGGMEVEMLYTYANLEPSRLEYHNTTSLVFRVTAQDNTVMVLGDASNRASKHLTQIYGDYLKSDIVQLSHHGYTGGTVALYEDIDAEVVLWPTGVASIDGRADTRQNREYNAKAVSLAKEVYIAGDTMYTLILPYTPDPEAQSKYFMD